MFFHVFKEFRRGIFENVSLGQPCNSMDCVPTHTWLASHLTVQSFWAWRFWCSDRVSLSLEPFVGVVCICCEYDTICGQPSPSNCLLMPEPGWSGHIWAQTWSYWGLQKELKTLMLVVGFLLPTNVLQVKLYFLLTGYHLTRLDHDLRSWLWTLWAAIIQSLVKMKFLPLYFIKFSF